MAIPQIVSGSLVQTPSSGVKIDSGAFREAALAPGRVGAAIGQDVGGLFQDVSQKIQANKNAGTVFRADLAMRKAKDDFTAQLVTMPDPQTWVPAWNQQTKALRDSIMDGPGVGPDVKRHLGMMMDNWEQATTSETKIAALLKQNADTRDSAVEAATYAAHQGQLDDANNALKAAVEAHAMSQAEANKVSKGFPVIAAKAQISTLISNDAISAPRIINEQFKDKLPPQEFRIIQHVAAEAQSAKQADNQEIIAAAIDDNPLHTYDTDLLKQKRDAEIISVPGYLKSMARIKSYADAAETANKQETRLKSLEERNDFNVTMMQADNPPTDATTLDSWSAGIKENGLAWTNPALRRRLNEYVDSKVKSVRASGQKEERPVESRMYELMDEDRMHGGTFIPPYSETTTHWFKPDETKQVRFGGSLADLRKLTDEDAAKTFGKGSTARGVIAAEQANYAKKREEMRQWFAAQGAAGKKPTIEEANEYRMKLEAPDIISAVAGAAGSGKKRRLVKQGGKTYDYDTGEEVK